MSVSLPSLVMLPRGSFAASGTWCLDDDDEQQVKSYMLSNNRIPKKHVIQLLKNTQPAVTPSEQSLPTIPICDECKQIVQQIHDDLNDTKKLNRLKLLLKITCEYFLPQFKIERDPELACKTLKLCSSMESLDVPAHLYLNVLHSAQKMLQLSSDESSRNVICDECQFAINEFRTIVTDPAVQKQVAAELKKICMVVRTIQPECESAIDSYVPLIFDDISEYMKNPLSVCQSIKFCSTSSLWISQRLSFDGLGEQVALKLLELIVFRVRTFLSFKQPVPSTVEEIGRQTTAKSTPVGCLFCEFVLPAALQYLERNEKLLDMTSKTFITGCNALPEASKRACVDFMTIYLKPFLKMSYASIDADKLCHAMQMCTGAQSKFNIRHCNTAAQYVPVGLFQPLFRLQKATWCNVVVGTLRNVACLMSPLYSNKILSVNKRTGLDVSNMFLA
ncbi:unnamed protein product [Soboliphyme baturini]|uniref:Saposin B-type domain-containing protein n=1 Tax=Soboliphyme baturini TaxID=241478 RepID=A0A183IKL1_9BILA|nr:unnamed protein product [Soboliphyme baturini]